MRGRHPAELDLAWLSDAENRDALAEHMKWCSSCRRVLADYDWLQGELAEALDAQAEVAPVAAPDWDEVRRRLKGSRERLPERRLLVAASVALIACVMLVAPAVLGREVQAQTVLAGELQIAPQPVIGSDTGVDTDVGGSSPAMTPGDTMMPAGKAAFKDTVVLEHREGTVSLPFAPPPTPPEQEG
jgi:predicted anti-sigma-YlaC factor YlaD